MTIRSVTEKDAKSQDNVMTNKIAYSVEEISEQTTLSKPFLRNEIRAGKLKVKRCGRRVLILKDDFMNYLNGENKDEK
jgi:excisionase family DNA binding protein